MNWRDNKKGFVGAMGSMPVHLTRETSKRWRVRAGVLSARFDAESDEDAKAEGEAWIKKFYFIGKKIKDGASNFSIGF